MQRPPSAAVSSDDAYSTRWEDVARGLGVDPERGLSEVEAAQRLIDHGPNEVEPPPRPSLVHLLWEVVTEPFLLMLLAAGSLAVLLGEVRDGLLIIGGLIPIVAADVATSYRAERALEALRAASAPTARVRRDGEPALVPARDVVPGDILLLRTGDVVAADARVIAAFGALVDRSLLTGESVPEPCVADPDAAATPLADRRSMVQSGTSLVAGSAEAVVVSTGRSTEMGRIAASLGQGERRRSPIQLELDRLVRIMLIAASGLIMVTVGLGFLRGNPPGQNLLAGISAAIAAIPEEPPVLLAVILGLGAYRMLRRGVLVRRLNAQETLGAVDLILTDKTGTLTLNRLEVADVLSPEGPIGPGERDRVLADALRAEADAWRSEQTGATGALSHAIERAIARDVPRPSMSPAHLIRCEPPADGHPYSLVEYQEEGLRRTLAVGAPESILALCDDTTLDGGPGLGAWSQIITTHADAGSRLLLLASRDRSGSWTPQALIAFRDRLRPEVPNAVAAARDAGVEVVMVTGDHPGTAAAIAAEVGLPVARAWTGSELALLSAERLAFELPGISVVARATPNDKLRLVEAAHRAARTVAVTGDGVNDAPALHAGDVGVAMGSGTAVACEAADLVLGDDSFATLMDGLREGRRMIANVQKGLAFLLSTHVALLGFVLLGTIAGQAQPLLPIQILWAELFIDISASVTFEREAEEPGAMQRPPRPRAVPLIDRGVLLGVALAGGFTAVGALVLVLTVPTGDHARWLAFTVLAIGQALRAYANRSLVVPITRLPPNTVLLAAVALVIAVQVAIPLIPPLAEVFRATPLNLGEWGLVAAIAVLPALLAQVMRARGLRWIA